MADTRPFRSTLVAVLVCVSGAAWAGDPWIDLRFGPVYVSVQDPIDFEMVAVEPVVYDLDEHVAGAPGIVRTDTDTDTRDYVREWMAVALRKV